MLFCFADDAYSHLNPRAKSYESIKRLSDSEVLTLALFQQFRGVESERSFLRDAQVSSRTCSPGWPTFSPLFVPPEGTRAPALPGAAAPRGAGGARGRAGDADRGLDALGGLAPQAGRAVGWLGGVLLRRGVGRVGIVRRLRGQALHLLCSTARVPLSYELTPANTTDVLLVRELLAGAGLEEDGVARKLFGDLAYRGGELEEELAEAGVLLRTEKADRRPTIRQQGEVCFAALKRVLGAGETLAKTLTGLVTRIAAKVAAYTLGLYVNRLLGRPQGRIKEL